MAPPCSLKHFSSFVFLSSSPGPPSFPHPLFSSQFPPLPFLDLFFPPPLSSSPRPFPTSPSASLTLRKELDPVVFKRARHVVMENERVSQTVEALKVTSAFFPAGPQLLAERRSQDRWKAHARLAHVAQG
eukprot:575445-Hanusia_phi.AAC.1